MILLAAVAAAIAAAAPASRADTRQAAGQASFRLDDGSVGCRYLAATVSCRNLSGAPALMIARALQAPRPLASSLVRFGAATPVLHPGSVWRRNGLDCRVRAGGIWCLNNLGAGMEVSRHGFIALAAQNSTNFATGGP